MSDAERQPRKPVILSVDDDPAVSRAVARDLRRHYGERYRIVRAESGPDALTTLHELKLRGDTVAVFVADYRMPQMSGIEFLEAAMDLYPMARRVLLTAYADTTAAIDAINVVDLDHYLLKPWDPPEEKLYPVIDGLLESWHAAGDHAIPYTKVIGHQWNPRSWDVRQFLARNGYPFKAFTAEEPKGRQLLEAAGLDGRQLPVVITEDGKPMVEPTDTDLANMLGLSTDPSLEMYDLAVIGGGPAGLAAAVYGASEGLNTVLIERATTGGQAGRSSRIENYLGFENGISGIDLTTTARRQAERFGAEVITTRKAVHLQAGEVGTARTITFSDDNDGTRTIGARAVILATGVDYRELSVGGCSAAEESNLIGRGVYYGASVSDAAECAGEEVYIVGGANSAGQAAMFMSKTAKNVTMLVRGPSLEASMSYYLIQQIEATENIHVRTCTEVVGTAAEDDHLVGLTLADRQSGQTEEVPANRLCCFIGATPRTDWLDGVVARDDHGFILAGPDLRDVVGWTLDRPPHHLETSVPGVFVAGDVRSESAKRVAAAVGEGSMAVMFVHRYLAEA
ncbi:FAD-dependent oxidoreductase [Mycobacterium sp. C31M]